MVGVGTARPHVPEPQLPVPVPTDYHVAKEGMGVVKVGKLSQWGTMETGVGQSWLVETYPNTWACTRSQQLEPANRVLMPTASHNQQKKERKQCATQTQSFGIGTKEALLPTISSSHILAKSCLEIL